MFYRHVAWAVLLAAPISGCGAPLRANCGFASDTRLIHNYPRAASPTRLERLWLASPDVPNDWQELPRSGVVYARDAPDTRALWFDGDVIVRAHFYGVTAHDRDTGRPVWRQLEQWSSTGVGCQRVVQVGARGVRGLDARTGVPLWTRSHPSDMRRVIGFDDCLVVIASDESAGEWNHVPLEVAVIDARTGDLRSWTAFRDPGMVSWAGAHDLRIRFGTTDEYALWFSLPDGAFRQMPLEFDCAVGSTVVSFGSSMTGHARDTGEVRWTRPLDAIEIGRDDESLLVRSVEGLQRLSATTGETQWISRALARSSAYAVASTDADRTVVVTNSVPPIVLQVDAEGHPTLRLAPFRTTELVVQGRFAAVFDDIGWALLDLEAERAPVRRTRTLADDVSRAMERLLVPLSPSDRIDPDTFPAGELEALDWLHRARDEARPHVVRAILGANENEASAWLPLLSGDRDPQSLEAVSTALTRTWGAPSPARVALRTAAARAVSGPLTSAIATRLADETIRWAHLRDRTGRMCVPWRQGSRTAPDLEDAVVASLAALERGSEDAEPLRRVRRDALGTTPSCGDAVCAAERWALETGVRFDWMGRLPHHDGDNPGDVSLLLGAGSRMQSSSVTLRLRAIGGEWRVLEVVDVSSAVI